MRCCLLLHGFLTDENDFKEIIPNLKEIYDYVHPICFPGHGEKFNFNEFTVDKTFEVLLNTFDQLNEKYEVIDVIGFSMGGALATYLSSVRDFNKLVLLSPANKYLNFRTFFERLNFFLEGFKKRKKLKETDKERIEVEKKLSNVRKDEKEAFKIAFERLIPHYNIRNLATFSRIIKRCNKELVEIKNPTLIIWGYLDQMVPVESVEFDYELCSNSQKKLLKVDGLSHLMLNSTDISLVKQEIVSFLK